HSYPAEALDLFNSLLRTDLKPNEETITNILSVCADLRIDKVEVLGRVLHKELDFWSSKENGYAIHGMGHSELEEDGLNSYVLMANIYTSASKRKEAAKIRSMTRNKGLVKAGWSRIEINGLIHVFMAGDQSDHQSVDIYEKLNELNTKLKEAGYVAESHHGKNY
ncbi:hypothetical protein Gohar_017451, partial [Gossypium harknessii]|nr:hypothetical protein [Gossypium harknessii]